MHKVFWDMLREQLHQNPPKYDHAIQLLIDIKEVSGVVFFVTVILCNVIELICIVFYRVSPTSYRLTMKERWRVLTRF